MTDSEFEGLLESVSYGALTRKQIGILLGELSFRIELEED